MVDLSVTSQKATVLSLPPVMRISRSCVENTVDPRILPGCAHQLARSANSELNCCCAQLCFKMNETGCNTLMYPPLSPQKAVPPVTSSAPISPHLSSSL